jgi:hypothetical protein
MTMNEDLDNLDHIATQADQGAMIMDNPQGDTGEGGALAPQGPDYMTEARGTVDMFTAMMVGYAPKCESVWTEPAKARTAAALAPVMEKYGFNFGAMPPELTLIIVAGPLLWQSSRIVAAQMADDKAKAAKEKPKADKPDPMTMAAQPTGQPEHAPAQDVHAQVKLYP